MRTIEKIERVEKKISASGKIYYTTHAIAGGDEVRGYSTKKDEYRVNDEVMVFFDDRYNVAKMSKLDTK